MTNIVELSNNFCSLVEKRLVKDAALKEHIDDYIKRSVYYINTLHRSVQKNMVLLEDIKNKYSVNFDPELEENILSAMPAIETEITDAIKLMQNTHHNIKMLSERIHETAMLSAEAPNKKSATFKLKY